MRSHWLVLSVLSGTEKKTAESITSSGLFECYCPTYEYWLRLPKHIAKVEGKTRRKTSGALLPGYIFGEVSCEDIHLSALRLKFKEVFGIIKSSAGTVYVRDEEIVRLRSIVARGQFNALQDETASIDITDILGRVITIISGPLKGNGGKVVEFRNSELRIDIGSAKIWVDQGLIEAAA